MCQKCVRKSRNIKPGQRFGAIKVMANYDTRPTDANMVGRGELSRKFIHSCRPRPLYGKGDELAIEAHCERIRKARTNKKRYSRKRGRDTQE